MSQEVQYCETKSPKLELSQNYSKRLCMKSSEHKSANISPSKLQKNVADFWQVGIFGHALSKYLIKSIISQI